VMAKVPWKKEQLKEQLNRQIEFLRCSAKEFDEGREDEAVRLATTLRLLLHDTQRSRSLLGQLDHLDRNFWDTSWPNESNNIATTSTLVSIAMGADKTRFQAHLDDTPFLRQQPFNSWWIEPIFVDNQNRAMSRQDLVLIAANQAGGAHVDPSVDETYYDLEFQNSLGWRSVNGEIEVELGQPGRVALRQITHEVLKTLIKNYKMMPEDSSCIILGGMTISQTDP